MAAGRVFLCDLRDDFRPSRIFVREARGAVPTRFVAAGGTRIEDTISVGDGGFEGGNVGRKVNLLRVPFDPS